MADRNGSVPATSEMNITKMSLPKNRGDIGNESNTLLASLPIWDGTLRVLSFPAKPFGKRGVKKFNTLRKSPLLPPTGESGKRLT